MAGRGAAPKPTSERRNRSAPQRGEWGSVDAVGWQHGDVPAAPEGLTDAAVETWQVWFAAWFAAHWTPEDLPGLRTVIRLYDQVERGEFTRANELRLQMDTYGITPKGQQDRRWVRPSTDAPRGQVSRSKPRKLKAV